MSKVDLRSSAVIQTPDDTDAEIHWHSANKSSRFIVLIPPTINFNTITRRIWELAYSTNSNVQLLSLCKDWNEEPAVRRELVTLAALIRDASVAVETQVVIGTNWLRAVKRNYREGDMIVCVAEQTTGIWRRPLSQVLESNLKVPLYIMSGLPQRQSESSAHSQIIAWLGFLGFIIGFFVLQVKVLQYSKDWTQTLLLLLLLIPEFWLLWIWNSLFS